MIFKEGFEKVAGREHTLARALHNRIKKDEYEGIQKLFNREYPFKGGRSKIADRVNKATWRNTELRRKVVDSVLDTIPNKNFSDEKVQHALDVFAKTGKK